MLKYRIIHLVVLLFLGISLHTQTFSQESLEGVNIDTTDRHLLKDIYRVIEIDPVTITATLSKTKISKLPGRGAVVSNQQIEILPANNTDDLLAGVANVNVNRPWGIFSKGASVSMRGLPGSARTLILLNGVPMNKVSGGTVNWNFLEPSDIEHIEIIKGPNSALYGNNAMGGTINISTHKPDKPLEGNFRAFGGSMGTFGGSLMLGGNKVDGGKGFYWSTKGFFRQGDGYYIEPEETRDSTDAKVNLMEYNIGLQTGYRLDSLNTLNLEYRYYQGTFGTGTQIIEEDGSWDQYRSHMVQGSYDGQLGEYNLNARIYYQLENFDQQNESLNSSGKYKLADDMSIKHDAGLWMNASREFFRHHLFTAGLELKIGNMDARQIYRTSTDDVEYGGELAFAGLFLQDEYRITKDLRMIAGLRMDFARFSNGYQTVNNPTSNTGFLQDANTTFNDESWWQWSPKLALHYQILSDLSAYVSVATGFMPPKISDLSKSGKISKGFKLANPQLKPETLINYEAGITWMPQNRFALEPSVYYSRGHDFQYFVATGDSVETGGADLKPVLQRQNVSEVEILGAEITAKWEVISNLMITASYAVNNSRIIEFSDPYNEDKDLTGKSLIEVPLNAAYASISWRNRIVNFIFDWSFTGKEWYDDENTQYISPYSVFGLKLNKKLKQGIGFNFTIQNLFDNVTVDRKGKLTPGRFMMAEVFFDL